MNAIIVLGLLALSGTGECQITSWTTPLLASGADIDGGNIYLNEGDTTIYDFVAVSTGNTISSYEIFFQTETTFFVIGTATSGILTLVASPQKVLDGASGTLAHVVKIKATDSNAGTGTATLTINILPAQFTYDFLCVYVPSAVAVTTTVETNALSSTGTNTLAIASGNTNSDFTVSALGVIATDTGKTLTPASGTNGGYTLVITGADDVGTVSTVTTTVSICVRGSACTCTLSTCSGAAHITAGLLGMFAAVIMMLLK